MPSPKIPHYTRKRVQCPICGAFMRITQGLNGHIRFRHMGHANERGMLWKMQNDGFLPVIDYTGQTHLISLLRRSSKERVRLHPGRSSPAVYRSTA
jgi:hypothetical protein